MLSHLTPLFTETFSSDRFCLKYQYSLLLLKSLQTQPNRPGKEETSPKKSKEMPPRSVCLNVFTHSLGEGNGAVNTRNPMLERRDSAMGGMFSCQTPSHPWANAFHVNINIFLQTFPEAPPTALSHRNPFQTQPPLHQPSIAPISSALCAPWPAPRVSMAR